MTDGRPGDGRWPELPWHEWADALATLHLWTQIVGKTKLACRPTREHPWEIALLATERGLTTGSMAYAGRELAIDFDFVDHRLTARDGAGQSFVLELQAMTVADFYRRLMAGLAGLDFDIRIKTRPFDVADPIPFDADEVHQTYRRGHAESFLRALRRAQPVLERFQAGFDGATSPVVFYWGSFDLSTSRFGTAESTCGWWPLDRRFGPAFYAYTKPAPPGLSAAGIGPVGAWNAELGEFILPEAALRQSTDSDGAALSFLEATYRAGTRAKVG